MKAIAMIPARYEASRFPGKLMQLLGDKTVIRRTYEAACATNLFDQVYVVTDSDAIEEEIVRIGGKVIRSRQAHESGTDRVAEAAREMNVDVIVNVQGDSPFIKKEPLQQLLQEFNDPIVQVGSLMRPLSNPDDIQNPNVVKVVVNKKNDSIFFSRSVIPYPRDPKQAAPYYEHVGVYAFRTDMLLAFSAWPAPTGARCSYSHGHHTRKGSRDRYARRSGARPSITETSITKRQQTGKKIR